MDAFDPGFFGLSAREAETARFDNLLMVVVVFIDDIRKAQQAAQTSTALWSPFEQQAERTPQAIAVVDSKRSFTYAELKRCANEVHPTSCHLGIISDSKAKVLLTSSAKAMNLLQESQAQGYTKQRSRSVRCIQS